MPVHVDFGGNTHASTLGESTDTSSAHHPDLWKTVRSELPAGFRETIGSLCHARLMTPPPKPPREHDLGLEYDLGTLHRRRFLGLFAGAGLAAVAGCTPDDTTDSATSGSTTTTSGVSGIRIQPDSSAWPMLPQPTSRIRIAIVPLPRGTDPPGYASPASPRP